MSVVVKNNQKSDFNLSGYLFIYIGQVISLFGSSIASFIIVWWITISTGSALYLALSSLVAILPVILLGPFIGVYIDRWRRKYILLIADFSQAVLTFLMILAFITGFMNIPVLLILLLIKAIFQAFQTPAFFSIIPAMVPREKLSRINSLTSLLNSLVQIMSPVFAAFLFTLFLVSEILWLDIITFFFALFPLMFVKIPELAKSSDKRKTEKKSSFKSDLFGGFHYLRSKKGLLPLLFSYMMVNLTIVPSMTLLPLFIVQDHNGSAGDFASILLMFQVGILCSSLIFLYIKINRLFSGVFIGIIGIFTGILIMSVAPGGVIWIVMLGAVVIGFTITIAQVSSQTLWQQTVILEYQGRINSLRSTLASFAQPLGLLSAGLLAEFISISSIFAIYGSIGLVIFITFVLVTSISKVEQNILGKEPEPIETKTILTGATTNKIHLVHKHLTHK